MAVILVGGGSRSGKTAQALKLARARGSRLAYVATAETLDEEMARRAAAHRVERGAAFETIEEPIDVGGALARCGGHDAVVVDCLTLWLNNLLARGRDPGAESEAMLRAALLLQGDVIFVTNEVGCGIVPADEVSRRFRDEAGWLNQRVAAAAEEVYFMAFGCAVRVK